MVDDRSVVRLAGEGRTLGAGSNVITYKLTSAETTGAFSVLERVVPPHFQSPPQPHTNTREDWAAYVLDGVLAFQLEDRELTAPAGSLVFVPRGVFFRWWNPQSEPARCLMIYAPAGFEEYFSEVTDATKDAPRGPLDYERTLPTILRIQDKYGMRRRE
jgi:mannose-6-phosphate isomerase-like protein (cupin superfamily)